MTKNEGAVPGGIDYVEATGELRRTLAERLRGRPLPPDLVVTTRSEIERREFRAYGQGWRDRGEHEARRAEGTDPAARTADGAKVLPFPQSPPAPAPAPEPPVPQPPVPQPPASWSPGPHAHPSGPPTARPHPSDDPS
ncbi:hypothetical protein ABZ923_10830 [Streptomyces sp. NPDC046881]|uniref:hypothetical protein n=1 Tax=Streptomyces sp. NPDC046881 TaxID=3155374 RepID=UPI0034049713